jgi:hypothetical protein
MSRLNTPGRGSPSHVILILILILISSLASSKIRSANWIRPNSTKSDQLAHATSDPPLYFHFLALSCSFQHFSHFLAPHLLANFGPWTLGFGLICCASCCPFVAALLRVRPQFRLVFTELLRMLRVQGGEGGCAHSECSRFDGSKFCSPRSYF